MKKLFLYVLLLVLKYPSCFALPERSAPSLTIVDTDGKSAYAYRSLMLLAESVGFTVSFRSFFDLLENPHIEKCDALLIALHHPFLGHLEHAVSQRALRAIQQAIECHQPAVGLILPHRLNNTAPLFQRWHTFLQAILGNAAQELIADSAFCVFSTILFVPSAGLTDTTLLTKNERLITQHQELIARELQNLPVNKQACFMYPSQHHNKNISSTENIIAPMGVILSLPGSAMRIFIGSAQSLLSGELEEDCMNTPQSWQERERLLLYAQSMLAQFHRLCMKGTATRNIPSPGKLPTILTDAFVKEQRKHHRTPIQPTSPSFYQWMNKGISCAWIDLADFSAVFDETHSFKKAIAASHSLSDPQDIRIATEKSARERGVSFIVDADFNLLWFEFFPELYLSNIGTKRADKEHYLQQIIAVAHQLKEYCRLQAKPLPKIFVGMNLTTNFRNMNAEHPAYDIFGTRYPNVPSPMDVRHFWQSELVETFNTFCDMVHDILPIDGVFFDFEMYHAPQQASCYTNFMDFSDASWHSYCASQSLRDANKLTTVDQRVTYLIQTKKLTSYFNVLEKEAYKLGRNIKDQLRARMPHLIFAAYAPTLPHTWFYRGLCAGLSSPQEPLLFASFNTHYFSHHTWLVNHGIHLAHSQVAMLSKFVTPHNTTLIDDILARHHFIWFNRPTRMVYQYTKEDLNRVWWGIEASPIASNELAQIIRTTVKKSVPSFLP